MDQGLCDGLVLPDRTPSPGLLEYAKVIAPVRIGPGPKADTVLVENRYDVLDLSHLRFTWSLDREGVELASGMLPTPQLAAGEHGRLPLPRLDPPPATAARCPRGGEDGGGELWLTVEAELDKPADWAAEGRVVAWGQLQLSATDRRRPIGLPGVPARSEGEGPSATPPTGRTAGWTGCGTAPSPSPRAHTAWPSSSAAPPPRAAPATSPPTAGTATVTAFACVYVPNPSATGRGDDFHDTMVDPVLPPEEYQELVRRDRSRSLARIGLDWEILADRSQVEWFGTGPGEAYPDSCQAVRVGRFRAPLDRPTARRRTAPGDLVPGPAIDLHTDHAVQGLGTAASCHGAGVAAVPSQTACARRESV